MDKLAEAFTVIRNGYASKKNKVMFFHSSLKERILFVLKTNGYIKDYTIQEKDNKKHLIVYLNYINSSERNKDKRIPFINGIEKFSKISLRKYSPYREMRSVYSNNGFFIVSTSKGIMTSIEARRNKLGGELIAKVW